MPTYQECPKVVHEMAAKVIDQFESHHPLRDNRVTFSLLFAYGERDENTGELKGDAITHHGQRALGLARIVNEKDRVKGCPDAEILLDGDYWPTVDEAVQEALLDHELHHISLKLLKGIVVQHDCAGRPKLKMRKHDVEIGWFKCIAERHGEASMERQQAKHLLDVCGQYFWPQIAGPAPSPSVSNALSKFADAVTRGGASATISSGTTSVTIDAKAAAKLRKAAEALRQ